MKQKRTVQTLSAAAAILIVLGLGNLYYGQTRLWHYQEALSAANQQLATGNTAPSPDNLTAPGPNIDHQLQIIKRLKTRVDFFSLAVLGGRCFLALACACLLAILLIRSMTAAGPSEIPSSSE